MKELKMGPKVLQQTATDGFRYAFFDTQTSDQKCLLIRLCSEEQQFLYNGKKVLHASETRSITKKFHSPCSFFATQRQKKFSHDEKVFAVDQKNGQYQVLTRYAIKSGDR